MEAGSHKPPFTLRDGFHHYNRLLFNGALPNISIKWGSLRDGLGGSAHAKVIRYTHATPIRQILKPGSLGIQVSSVFRRNNRRRDQILIHEMIHISMYLDHRFDEGHGPSFQAEVFRCQVILGFSIPIYTIDHVPVASDSMPV